MKRIEAEDAWRRATTKDRDFKLVRMRAIGKQPLADLDEELDSGLLIICGLNGTAKTTVLRLIEGALRGTVVLEGRCRASIVDEGAFILTVERNHDSIELALGEDSEHSPPSLLLDAFTLCGRLFEVSRQPNFQDLLVGVDGRDYEVKELELASYVVGKHYDAIRVFEVESPGEDDVYLPVFEVTSQGASYDFTAMGTGELAALAALWHLDRVDRQTVVLVEEPETFLSASSTIALLDVIAESVERRSLYAVVTTHSIEIVARAPLTHMRLMVSTDNGIVFRKPATRAELEQMLGAYVGQARLLFVEDRIARLFVSEVVARFGGLWGEAADVVMAGDVQRVLKLCKDLPRSDIIRVAGVLDGDQDVPNDSELEWPVFVLPGGAPPDALLRDAALSNREMFVDRIGRSATVVDGALETVAGRDVHDWFPELAKALKVEVGSIVRAALDCWLAVDENSLAAKDLVQELTEALVA